MIFFVSQMIKLCSQPEQGKCINILGAFIKETDTRYINEHIDRREYEWIGSHSINIIFSALGKLPSVDYSHLILDGAYLVGADLSNKDFSHTSMRNSNLYNVNFENANFSYTDISNSLLDKTSGIKSICKVYIIANS